MDHRRGRALLLHHSDPERGRRGRGSSVRTSGARRRRHGCSSPSRHAQGRRAQNPLDGEILPAVYIGRLVPNSGNFINGMEVFDGTPQQKSPFKVAPRIGFAWDVTGDGKTAVRGGWGIFYDRYSDDNILDLIELPPVLNTYNLFYTTLPELLNNPLTATPTGVRLHRRVHAAGRLQLEPRRPARNRLPARRRRGLRRQRRRVTSWSTTTPSTAGRMATPTSRRAWIPPSSRAVRPSRFPTTSCDRTRDMAQSPSARLPDTATTTRCRCR